MYNQNFLKYGDDILTFARKIIRMTSEFALEGIHWLRVTAGGGAVEDRDFTEEYYKLQDELGLLDSLRLAVFPNSGKLERVNGIYKYVEKLFSLAGVSSDVSQTTANSQPYLIRKGIKNPNGGTRFVTHGAITRTGAESWTASFILNWNGTINAIAGLVGKGSDTASIISLRLASNNRFSFINESATAVSGVIGTTNKLIGKDTVVQFRANGTILAIYINNTIIETLTVNTGVVLSSIVKAYSTTFRDFNGTIKGYTFNNALYNDTQSLAEYNFFRTKFTEIETTNVGANHISVENCEMVATPMGNVIPGVQDAAVWVTSIVLYNAVISGGGTELSALKAAAMWRSPNSSLDDQAVFGRIYNGYATKLLQMDIDAYNTANPTAPWGYHVATAEDVESIASSLGGKSIAGKKIKSSGSEFWVSDNGSDESGMSVLGSGYIGEDGEYRDRLKLSGFWTATQYGDTLKVATVHDSLDNLIIKSDI